MKAIFVWLAIVSTSLVPSYILASNNPHVETCVRIVNANKATTDDTDTYSNCRFIENSHATACLKLMAAGFSQYEISQESVYDGIDGNHVLACAFFYRDSSVKCLGEILTQHQQVPTVSDILYCEDK